MPIPPLIHHEKPLRPLLYWLGRGSNLPLSSLNRHRLVDKTSQMLNCWSLNVSDVSPFRHTNGRVHIKLTKLPEVLCLHLKRFRHDFLNTSKIYSPVDFPIDGLDLSPFLHSSCADKVNRSYHWIIEWSVQTEQNSMRLGLECVRPFLNQILSSRV